MKSKSYIVSLVMGSIGALLIGYVGNILGIGWPETALLTIAIYLVSLCAAQIEYEVQREKEKSND